MATKVEKRTSGIRMTKKNRLAILTHARAILSDPKRWTKRALRRKSPVDPTKHRFCLLGACEQAAYELGLAEPDKHAFQTAPENKPGGIGYLLGPELSLTTFSQEKFGMQPYSVNDTLGYGPTLQLLDEYIDEVKKGKPRKQEAES